MGTPLWQHSATTLSGMLERREVSSREVVDAHLDRIASVDGAVRAFTEVFREGARADADRADAERAKGRSRGPLHGLPVSVKECFDFEGRATTLGIPAFEKRIAARDAVMVTALREAGAVILGRTNLSQTMLFAESRNPIFGQTCNPFSLSHTPGGSSGGETAALAAGMSPLGLGTDIGGSIRSPAHFSGVTALKPTLDRLPARGQRAGLPGQEVIRGVCGPVARTTDDLWLFLRALDPARLSALDGRVPPLPWKDPSDVALAGLRVGFYTDDGVLAASRSIVRAVDLARDALEARGCHVRPYLPPDVMKNISDYISALSSDGAKTLSSLVRDPRELDPVLAPLLKGAQLPTKVRLGLARAAELAGQKRAAMLLRAVGEKSVAELWRLTDALRGARATLLDSLDANGIDVILCPAYATPALPHGMSKNFTLASSTAMLWNLHQLPAGVVPVTRVRPDETTRSASRELLERQAAKVDAESAGLPVGVQVVARPWAEATVLAVMRAIEEAARNDPSFPHTPVTPRS